MKYIAVIVMLVLMGWTWSMATSERPFKLEQHRQVELGVEQDIRGFILRRFPETKEIYCQQLYTQVSEVPNELIARFRCQAASAEEIPEAGSNAGQAAGIESGAESVTAPAVASESGLEASAAATGEITEQVFEGYLRLKSDDGFKTWSEIGGEIRSPEIRFLRGACV